MQTQAYEYNSYACMQEFRRWTQNSSELVMPRPRPDTHSHKQGRGKRQIGMETCVLLSSSGFQMASKLQQLYAEAQAKGSTAAIAGQGHETHAGTVADVSAASATCIGISGVRMLTVYDAVVQHKIIHAKHYAMLQVSCCCRPLIYTENEHAARWGRFIKL